MGLIRNFRRKIERWIDGLVHGPGWSPSSSRIGAWFERVILRLSQISTPGAGAAGAGSRKLGASIWRPGRWILLACGTVGSVVVLLAVITQPLWKSAPTTSYRFPEEMSMRLEGLRVQSIESVDAEDRAERIRSLRAQAVAHYPYELDGRTVDVELRYYERSTGDVGGYARARLDIEPNIQIRSRSGIGDYGWFAHENRLWLTTCLDVRGIVTVRSSQFDRNRRLHDRDLQQILRWMFGRGPLEDRRAVWLLVSMELNGLDLPAALKTLEPILAEIVAWRRTEIRNAEEIGVTGECSNEDTGLGLPEE